MEIYLLTALCLVLALYYRGQRVDPKIKEDYDYFVEATGWTKGKSIGAELIHSRRYVEALESRCGALSEAIKIAIDREVDLENRLSQALSERDEQKRAYEDLHAEATRTASEVLQIGDPVYTGDSEAFIGFATETVGSDETVAVSLTHHGEPCGTVTLAADASPVSERPRNDGGHLIHLPNGETLDLHKPVVVVAGDIPLRNANGGFWVVTRWSSVSTLGSGYHSYTVEVQNRQRSNMALSTVYHFDVPA